jgi:hypothetical protein
MPGNSSMEDYEMPEADEVPRRLNELGLSLDLLLRSIRRGQHAADFCTASHPKTYPGSVAYGETVAGLREQTAASGWSFNDDDNIPRAVSPDGSVVVTAVSGNNDTGRREGRNASTRRPRGIASVRIVRRNGQLELEALLPPHERLPAGDDEVHFGPTWYLLYCRDGDVIRSELSLAKGVNETGALLEWSERLILPEIDLTVPQPDRVIGDDDDDAIDVPVERRVS